MDPTRAPSFTSLQQAQPTTQFATDFDMTILPTARKSEHSLERGASRPFIYQVSLSSFHNMIVPLRELLQTMHNLYHLLMNLGSADRGQASVDKRLQTISRFGHPLQEGLANSRQGAVLQSDSRHQRAKIRLLRNQLDASEAHYHQLRPQLRPTRDTLASIEKKFNALAADYYCLANRHRRFASDTKEELEPKLGRAPGFSKAFSFSEVGMKSTRTMILRLSFVFVAVVHVDINEMYVGSRSTYPKSHFFMSC